jgi:hypothetical protein
MRHADYEPGSDWRGNLIGLRDLTRRRGVYPVWECDGCGMTNDPAIGRQLETVWRHLTDSGKLQRTADTRSGAKTMKLKFVLHRKASVPNSYGSEGPGAELEIEIDDEATAQEIMDQAQLRYGQLELMVDRQLNRMIDKAENDLAARRPRADRPDFASERQSLPPQNGHRQLPAQAPQEEPEPIPDSWPPDRRGSAPPARNGYGSSIGNQRPAGGNGRNDPPRSGSQLLGWANNHGQYEAVTRLGKAWNIPGRVKDWPEDAVQAVFNELSRGQQPAAGQWGGRN